jgi:uncharacterized Zn finger protein
MSWGYEYGYRDYVPVGLRKLQARKEAARRAKEQGRDLQPVKIKGRKIATTFWGKAWCDHLESYSDYANRLPRGRTYARNGSVVDLVITAGRIEAIVAGSDAYEIEILIDQLPAAKWKKLRGDCSASIDSLLDLLGGRFSDGIMERLTDRSNGLFPSPKEISMECSCPDWAGLCKHLAAVLYGVGAHLDAQPELLFLLRDVDHTELVSEAVSEGNLSTAFGEPSTALAGEDLGAMFGIDLDVDSVTSDSEVAAKSGRKVPKKKVVKRWVAKKLVNKKLVRKKVAKKKVAKKKVAKKKAVKKKVPKKKPAMKKAATKSAVKKKSSASSKKKKAGRKKASSGK